MRTLKKTLSLILVLVMVLGLATSAFAKTSFVDDAKIEYDEAAAVLTAVGLAQGNEKGEYNPQGDMTRAEAATFITRLVGMEGLNAKSTFPDMAGYDWAQPYVAFCQSQGFVSGDENGNFKPSEKITGYTFGKMLLCALGYDAEQEGLVGASWSFNIAKLLLAKDLTDGLPSNFDLSKILSRDEAGQMLFNTLTAVMMEYRNNFTASGENFNVSISGKASAVEGSKKDDYDAAYEDDDGNKGDGLMQLCEQFFKKLKKNAVGADDATDVFGRPNSYTWTYDKTPIYTVEKTSFLTYTKATKAADIEKALKNYEFATTTVEADGDGEGEDEEVIATNFYVNGDDEYDPSERFDAAGVDPANMFEFIAFFTGNGSRVELFANSNKEITDIVVIEYNVGKVTVETDDDGDTKYTIEAVADDAEGYAGIATEGYVYADEDDDDTVVLGGAIEDGDIVTYTSGLDADGGDVLYIYPTTLVTGDQQSTTQNADAEDYTSFGYPGKVNISGTSYTIGDAVGYTLDFYSNTDGTDTYFYLDQYGYVIHHADVDTSTHYAVVLGIAQKIGGLDSDSVNARLLFTDGTTKDVTVVENDDDYMFDHDALFGDGAEWPGVGYSAEDEASQVWYGMIVTYKINEDGEYKLTNVTDDGAWVKNGTITTKGTPAICDGEIGKDSTIYLVATGSKSTTYNVYTGYSEVPSYAIGADPTGDFDVLDPEEDYDGDLALVTISKDSKQEYVKVVFIDIGNKNASTTEVKDVLFISNYGVTKSAQLNPKYSVEGYVNGKLEKTVYGEDTVLYAMGDENDERYYEGRLFVVEAYNAKNEIKTVRPILSEDLYTVTINGSGTALYTEDADENEVRWAYPTTAKTYVITYNEKTEKFELKSGSINSAKAYDLVYIVPVDASGSASEKLTIKDIYILKDYPADPEIGDVVPEGYVAIQTNVDDAASTNAESTAAVTLTPAENVAIADGSETVDVEVKIDGVADKYGLDGGATFTISVESGGSIDGSLTDDTEDAANTIKKTSSSGLVITVDDVNTGDAIKYLGTVKVKGDDSGDPIVVKAVFDAGSDAVNVTAEDSAGSTEWSASDGFFTKTYGEANGVTVKVTPETTKIGKGYKGDIKFDIVVTGTLSENDKQDTIGFASDKGTAGALVDDAQKKQCTVSGTTLTIANGTFTGTSGTDDIAYTGSTTVTSSDTAYNGAVKLTVTYTAQ